MMNQVWSRKPDGTDIALDRQISWKCLQALLFSRPAGSAITGPGTNPTAPPVAKPASMPSRNQKISYFRMSSNQDWSQDLIDRDYDQGHSGLIGR